MDWKHRQRAHHTSACKREGRWPRRVARATWRHSQLLLPCGIDCRRRRSPLGGLDRRSVETQLQEHAWIFALDQVVVCMVTTRPPKTIVEPTALGTVVNTDSKLLIYRLFQKGRVLAQDEVVLLVNDLDCLKIVLSMSDLPVLFIEDFPYVFITVIRDAKRAISHIEGSCGLWSSTEQSEQMW